MLVFRDETGKVIYVMPDGDLVSAEAHAMRRELQGGRLVGMARVVLDLARVRTIDNVGLEVIIDTCNRICNDGGELVIENASRDLKDLFSLIRYDRRLIISRTGWPR